MNTITKIYQSKESGTNTKDQVQKEEYGLFLLQKDRFDLVGKIEVCKTFKVRY
jgi:hypothetical protein